MSTKKNSTDFSCSGVGAPPAAECTVESGAADAAAEPFPFVDDGSLARWLKDWQVKKEKSLTRAHFCPHVTLPFSPYMSPVPFVLQLSAADGVGFEHACSESEAELFPVRGRTYLGDRIKQPSASAAFRLISVLLVPSSRKLRHICASHPLPPRPSGAPPVVLIMFQVPGSPRLHLIFVLERDYTQDEVSADSPNTHTCHI